MERPLLLVCSSGGHLAQLVPLQPWWSQRERIWVTFPTADAESLLAGERLYRAHYPTTRNIPNLIRNFFLAIKVMVTQRPSAVLTTGAGVALPFFVLAWMMRVPTFYIEVFDRMDTRTLTARLCAPFTTRMLVQWPEQQELYPGSELVGPLL